jgi:hypothetical protein
MPIIALPLFASAVWSDPRWRGVAPFSLVVAVVVTAVVFLPPAPADSYAIWTGPGSMVLTGALDEDDGVIHGGVVVVA